MLRGPALIIIHAKLNRIQAKGPTAIAGTDIQIEGGSVELGCSIDGVYRDLNVLRVGSDLYITLLPIRVKLD